MVGYEKQPGGSRYPQVEAGGGVKHVLGTNNKFSAYVAIFLSIGGDRESLGTGFVIIECSHF